MLSALTLLLAVLVLAGIRLAMHRVVVGPAARDRTPSYQLATYHHGRVTHLTPVRDAVHAEDEAGDCRCRPHSGSYPMPDGPSGRFYVHRPLGRTRTRSAGRGCPDR